jgi:hypothetical protein
MAKKNPRHGVPKYAYEFLQAQRLTCQIYQARNGTWTGKLLYRGEVVGGIGGLKSPERAALLLSSEYLFVAVEPTPERILQAQQRARQERASAAAARTVEQPQGSE